MRSFIILIMLLGISFPAFSQTAVTGTIKMIRTGWDIESFSIVTVQDIQNPAGCPTPDGYMTTGEKPGYNTYYAAALTAFMERVSVKLTISNKPNDCIVGRPRLIGVNIKRDF